MTIGQVESHRTFLQGMAAASHPTPLYITNAIQVASILINMNTETENMKAAQSDLKKKIEALEKQIHELTIDKEVDEVIEKS